VPVCFGYFWGVKLTLRYTTLSVCCWAAFVLLAWLAVGCNTQDKPTRYIAYVGRYTNAKDTLPPDKRVVNPFDRMNERILQQYLEELNGELPHVRLALRT
jgi:hypothetical protein